MTYLFIAVAVLAVGLVVSRRRRAPAPPAAPGDTQTLLPRWGTEGPPPAGTPEALELASITDELEAHRRTAYLPIVEEGDGTATGSKFSGAPFLLPGETWPACASCGSPMQLFVQLSGAELPAAAQERVRPGELLQLFYCTGDEDCEYAAAVPFAGSTLPRIVPVTDAGSAPPPVPPGMLTAKRIVGWTEVEDYPDHRELDELEVELTHAERDTLGRAYPLSGEKLLGWPDWAQDVEYPACRTCRRPMAMLFQIDSERNLDHTFGDTGVGHVTQCPAHPAELAFAWSCV